MNGLKLAAQAQLADRDEDPHDEQGGARRIEHEGQQPAGVGIVEHDHDDRENDRKRNRVRRNTLCIGLREDLRCFVARGQRVHHAGGSVDLSIECGKQCQHDDDFHESRSALNSCMVENLSEWRLRRGISVTQRGVGKQKGNYQNGAQVEHRDAQDGRANGVDQGLFRIFRLSRRDGDDLNAAESECHGEQASGDAAQAIRHEAVIQKDLGANCFMPRQKTKNKQEADNQKGHDDEDLDGGEPVLKLAEESNAQQVHDSKERHANSRGNPWGNTEPRTDEAGGAGDLSAQHGHGG